MKIILKFRGRKSGLISFGNPNGFKFSPNFILFFLNTDFQWVIINFCVVPFIHFNFKKPSSFDMTQFQKGLSLFGIGSLVLFISKTRIGVPFKPRMGPQINGHILQDFFKGFQLWKQFNQLVGFWRSCNQWIFDLGSKLTNYF